MTPISKVEKPQVLNDNEVQWRDEYLAAKAAQIPVPDSIRYRYRHPDIKAALRLEAFGKCVYCETKVSVGEADHVFPVEHRPELIVSWDNLLLVCKECNTHKSSYYSDTEPLLNPSTEDPSGHIYFFGPAVMPRDGSVKGLRTILRMKLGRTDLLQRRFERVDRLRPLVQEYRLQGAGQTKDLLRSAILEEAKGHAEYSALVRSYLFQELGWLVNASGAIGLTQ